MGIAKSIHMPGIAGVITNGINRKIIKKAISNGADLLELRVDTFKDLRIETLKKELEKLKSFNGLCDIPIILTVRSKREGGRIRISDATRVGIFEALLPLVDVIDIELSSKSILQDVVNSARRQGKKVIISYHNFRSTPGDKALKKIIKKGLESGGHIIKIAAYAKEQGDLKRLAGILSDFKNLAVIAMGRRGAPSRVFFPMIGSLLTYGSITGKTAPGQLPIAVIKKEFKLYGFC